VGGGYIEEFHDFRGVQGVPKGREMSPKLASFSITFLPDVFMKK